MIIKVIVSIITALASIAFAHDTLVSTSTPYASGMVKLTADSDTVVFSNGVKMFSIVYVAPSEIPERHTWYGGIAFTYPSGQVVYKNSSSLSKQRHNEFRSEQLTQVHMALWTETTGNPDTVWTSANSIPGANAPADSLFIRISPTEISNLTVKNIYSSGKDIGEIFAPIASNKAQNFNSMLYFLSSVPNSPNMKFQVTSIDIDSSTYKTLSWNVTYKDYVVSGITVSWAVDSLGNGLFRQTTPVSMTPPFPIATIGKGSQRYSKVAQKHTRLSGSSVKNKGIRFSLKGASSKRASTAGVYIVSKP